MIPYLQLIYPELLRKKESLPPIPSNHTWGLVDTTVNIPGGDLFPKLGGAFLISALAKWPPLISWTTVLLAFTFSAAIGIIFGILPANQAANLEPIEALRRD